MNRKDRRPGTLRLTNAEIICLVMHQLAQAGPTATGATLILPSGETRYISVAEARAWVALHGKAQS